MGRNTWKILCIICMMIVTSICSSSFILAKSEKATTYPKKGELEIQKVDEDSSEPIKGATLKLVNVTDNLDVEEWVTDGSVKKIEVELHKTYKLVEVNPAKGYEKSDEITIQPDKDITIEDGKIDTVEPNKVFVGYRDNDEMRKVTDGLTEYVVYCINEKLKNPDYSGSSVENIYKDTSLPQYLHYTLRGIKEEVLQENQQIQVDRNGLANLLLAAYPSDIFGYKDKYNLTNGQAYKNTKNLIDAILKGTEKEQVTTGLAGPEYVNQAKYYNDLLKVYRDKPIDNADAYVDLFVWIKGTGQPEVGVPDKDKYQMLAGVTNIYPTYVTKVNAKGKKLPTVSVSVEKVWKDKIVVDHTHDEVRVQLYKDGTASGDEVVLNQSNNWNYTWDNLAQSSTWTVDEVKVKDGYEKDVQSQQNKFVITNTQIVGKVEITKEDVDTKRVLEGAKFDVYDQTGKSMGTITTDAQGKASIELPYGNYNIKEVQAPAGYQLSNKQYPVEIKQQGQNVSLTITNEQEKKEEDQPVVDDETTQDPEMPDEEEPTPNPEVPGEEETIPDTPAEEDTTPDADTPVEENPTPDVDVPAEEDTTPDVDVPVEEDTTPGTDTPVEENTTPDIDDSGKGEVVPEEEVIVEDSTSNAQEPEQESEDSISEEVSDTSTNEPDTSKTETQDKQPQEQSKENISQNNQEKEEKQTVQTSDTTSVYTWWLVLTCSMLLVVCGCKRQLNKK